jgi:hypothetical protein
MEVIHHHELEVFGHPEMTSLEAIMQETSARTFSIRNLPYCCTGQCRSAYQKSNHG